MGQKKASKIYWYECCFYGDEDSESDQYDSKRACSYVIKTEIPPIIKDETALAILFGTERERYKEMIDHCTCVMQIGECELEHFDVEDLTERMEDKELGIYYKRPSVVKK